MLDRKRYLIFHLNRLELEIIMDYKLLIANMSVILRINDDISWDKEAGQFIEAFDLLNENKECFRIFSFDVVDILPGIDREKLWENEICSVYIADGREVRYYESAITKIPYAISIDYSEQKQKILILRSWMQQHTGTKYLFNTIALERCLIKEGKLIFHTCYIRYRKEALLFTGFSGVGKSTQGALWEKYSQAEIVNGDRCILGYENNKWYAYGVPFSGTSHICKNIQTPIRAIVFLRQDSKENIKQIRPIVAAKLLWEQMSVNQWNKEFVTKTWDILSRIITEIPIYEFSCTKEEQAVGYLHQALFGE